jgi:16S rRNA processing protein RimM
VSTSPAPKRPAPRRTRREPKASQPEPKFLVIGKVLRPQGIRGELRLEIHTDSPTHLDDIETVYIGEKRKPYTLLGYRLHQGVLLITIEGSDDRSTADTFRGQLVSVKFEEAAPLKAGEFYHHQVVGLTVVTDEGETLGQVSEIITTGANDVYVVAGEGGEVLLPAIKSVVLKIEPPQMVVHLLEGLR